MNVFWNNSSWAEKVCSRNDAHLGWTVTHSKTFVFYNDAVKYITTGGKDQIQVCFIVLNGLTRAGYGYPHLRGGCRNPHCYACGCGLNLLRGRKRVEKFFVRVTECWTKACELNQLKKRKTCGCTEVASIPLSTVSLQQLLHYDVTTHCCKTLDQALVMWWWWAMSIFQSCHCTWWGIIQSSSPCKW